MQGRAIREGSVGLLILVAVGLFGGLVLWLRGLNPRSTNYRATFVFENTLGMQEGTAVRYRGVPVGRVLRISPATNNVEVGVEILRADLRIPSDSLIQANQSGLIGETTIDITPARSLSDQELALSPFGDDCDNQVIICDGAQLSGEVGASFDALIRSADGLATAFSDPEIIANLKTTLKNATLFTENATILTTELTDLSQQIQQELDPLVASANRATDSLGNAAAQFEITGTEINSLIVENRGSLVGTLDNINRSTADLKDITATISPAIQSSDFIQNLDALTADATVAVADIRAITSTFNSPENLVALQQTLDSARNVFQSAHKVLADVDELTGDPLLRQNIRDLINGLNTLVSVTEQLKQDSQLAQTLALPSGTVPERVTLTAVPATAARPGTDTPIPNSLLVTHDGQYYRLQVNPDPAQ
ncbi:MAG: MlaD family protein [Nodosilinea sp.]